LREYTLKDLQYFNGEGTKKLYILVNGYVYDVTNYNHPGGRNVFIQNDYNYHDLKSEFDSVGHSSSAKRTMQKFLVGVLKK